MEQLVGAGMLKTSAKANPNVTPAARPTPLHTTNAFRRKPLGREQSTGFERGAHAEQLKQQIRAIAAAKSIR